MGSPSSGASSSGGSTSSSSSSSSASSSSSSSSSSASAGGSSSSSSTSSSGGSDRSFSSSLSEARDRRDSDRSDSSASPTRGPDDGFRGVDAAGAAFGEFATSSGLSIDAAAAAEDEEDDASPPSTFGRDPGLTPSQSAALADSAAVMDGYAFSPASLGPPANDQPEPEERGFFERAGDAIVDTGELLGGVAVGAAETAWDGVVGTVGLVNDAAGTVLHGAIGWTGADWFEGHAERNAERGQAIVDAVASPIDTASRIADSAVQGWETFEDNWASGDYYAAGRQIGGVGLEVATVAVPAAKAGALGKLSKADDLAAAGRVGRVDDLPVVAAETGWVTRTADDLPDTVFRGDARPPHEIVRAGGFQPRGTATDLHDYALNNTPSVFVGTTPNVDRAIEFATDFGNRDGYVYAIDPRRGGVDVNATLRNDSPFPIEEEIAIPGGVPNGDIRGSWFVDRDGRFGPASELNDDYYQFRAREDD